ncbi:MAG TPA: permease prefix domain 1-containing protein, partial [Candidatus Dormibacteraeota bacterium]|nr:permease prefix domain 1-containing protein [Candidatus Dormibacteraeota bacterium]
MSLPRNIASGLRSLFRKEQVSRELDEELNGFLDMAVEEKVKQGMSRNDALRTVRLERGNVEVTKEIVRAARWESFLETCWQDMRFAFRMLRKSPGFTAVAVLTLALAIGANTAIFSVINSVLLQRLPYHDPDSLVMVWESDSQQTNPHNTVAPPNFLDWQSRNTVFSSMSFIFDERSNLTGSGDPQEVIVQEV